MCPAIVCGIISGDAPLVSYWQIFFSVLVTVPKVFAKVNSSQSPVSEVENSHNILTFGLTPTLPQRTLLRDLDDVKILNP